MDYVEFIRQCNFSEFPHIEFREAILQLDEKFEELKQTQSRLEPIVSLPPIKWEYEDQLPELSDKEYDGMFGFSRVIDGVRMFPFVEINNSREYLRSS